MAVGGVAALALVIAAVALLSRGSGPDPVRQASGGAGPAAVEAPATSEGEAQTEAVGAPATTENEALAAVDGAAPVGIEGAPADAGDGPDEAAAAPASDARQDETWRDGAYAPEPQGAGYLPVFIKAERQDKVIAITVDDCFQTGNLKEIIQLAEKTGGRLTIFPIGELMEREALQEALRAAYANGHEIENHTWSHDSLYNFTAEQLASHIFNQDRALDYVLGVNHTAHFLRPRGGDDRNDLRTHSYINQLGYYGIAHWSVSGTDSGIERIKKSLGPGEVYLFHCIDGDLQKLREFIPYAASQGYRLVTMNELFGYGRNYEEPLTDDPKTRAVPALEPYERDYKTIRATTYDYAAYEVQAALKKAGYLRGDPDGIYGKGTAKRAAEWQRANGFKADGVLTPEQQRKLFGVE